MWYKKLKMARKVLGITTAEVEKKTSINASYISKIEEPGYFKLSALLMFYNLDSSDMVD